MNKLTISLFGNTNNYPLLLAEGLMALGHQVQLFVNRPYVLHRPEAKYPEWKSNYPSWITDCSTLSDEDIAYGTMKLDPVLAHLTQGVDLVILNDVGPALADYLCSPYVVVLTGSDLTYYANYDTLTLRSSTWDSEFKRSIAGRRNLHKFADLITRQRNGILGAEAVSHGLRGLVPSGDAILDAIGVCDNRRFMLHLSDTMHLASQPHPRNNRMRVFSGARVQWRQSNDSRYSALDLKGTDILLKGFAQYCKQGGTAELRLPRKGDQVADAVQMIESSGIEDRICWLDEMTLAQFHQEMATADLVCDQLAAGFPGMVTLDAYAMGRPVLANYRNEIFTSYYGSPLPGLQARTPEEVCESLLGAERDRDKLERIGSESRAYAEAHLSPQRMAEQLLSKCKF